MAEQDFIISIRTTADTAGIKQTEAELRKLGVQVESVQKAGAATGAGAIGGGRGIAALFGVSAVGVGLGLKRLIEDIGNEQLRITKELESQLIHITKMSQKWAEMAGATKSQEDVQKLAASTLSELAAAQKQFNDFQNQGISGWQSWIDAMIKGPTLGGQLFGKFFQDQSSRLADNVTLTRQAAIAAADLAVEYKQAFDAEKAKPFEEAVASITAKIKEAEAAQAAAGTKNIEAYTDEGRKVQQYKAQLQEILNLEEKRKAKNEEAKSVVQKAFAEASPQAQGIIRNIEAAKKARAEGREREAELLEKTAERMRGQSPQGDKAPTKAGAEAQFIIDAIERANFAGVDVQVSATKDVVMAINRLADLWK